MSSRRSVHGRGTASVEILVMLPVFIALFFGVYHLHRSVQTELAVRQEARGCAWQYAMSGCKRGTGDGLCTNSTTVTEGANDKSDPDAGGKGVFATLASYPVIGDLVQFIFGEGMSATARVQTQPFLSTARAEKSAATYLVCNVFVESWEDKVKGALCGIADAIVGTKIVGCK